MRMGGGYELLVVIVRDMRQQLGRFQRNAVSEFNVDIADAVCCDEHRKHSVGRVFDGHVPPVLPENLILAVHDKSSVRAVQMAY